MSKLQKIGSGNAELNLVLGDFFGAVVWPMTSLLFSFEKASIINLFFFSPADNMKHAIGRSQVCWKHNVKIRCSLVLL